MNGSTYLQKNSTDAWYLPWQMAKDPSHLSLLQRCFCHENYLVLVSTQLFHQLLLPKCPGIRGSQSLLVLRDCFGHFAHVKFFATKFYVGFKVFVGATIHENWISWNFNPQNNSHTKFLCLRYVLIDYTITTSTLHLTHKISIHSDKLCVVPYIDIDHVQLVILPDHTPC